MKGYRFIDEKGTFTIDMPENYSYQYFPVAGENGIKSLLTSNLGGDSKVNQDKSQLTAGLMWQRVTRSSKKYQLQSKVTSFVPLDNNVEIMHVEITNIGKDSIGSCVYATKVRNRRLPDKVQKIEVILGKMEG